MNEKIKIIKHENKDIICLFKIGSFYHAYLKDAYILSYIFGYQIRGVETERECGFPIASIEKNLIKLESKQLNYILIDNKNEYRIEKQFYVKNNKYNEIYEISNRYVNYLIRINNIMSFLKENIEEEGFKNTLLKIEDIVYEKD